jgi:hypothetical protein
VPKEFLVDWLCVACYYPTTPTYYPSTTRGIPVGPFVAVSIDFCGYLQFLSISFVWIMWVQYATDSLSGQQSTLQRPVFMFQPTVNWRASDKQGEMCLEQYTHCAVAMCQHMNQGFWRGLGGGGGPFWLQRETLTFMGPAAYQNCGISDRNEQNSSKLQHTVCNIFGSHSAI